MKVSAEMKYVGAEKGTSNNSGKPYYVVGLLQGFDSERVYVSEEIYRQTASYKPFCDVQCQLNIQIGRDRTFVNLEKISLVKNDGAKSGKDCPRE